LFDTKKQDADTCLHVACASGKLDVVETLLEHGGRELLKLCNNVSMCFTCLGLPTTLQYVACMHSSLGILKIFSIQSSVVRPKLFSVVRPKLFSVLRLMLLRRAYSEEGLVVRPFDESTLHAF
jgi:hypothetical protein